VGGGAAAALRAARAAGRGGAGPGRWQVHTS
jgi:hypothetical protein